MKRRKFLALLNGAAVAWPLGASAQQAVKVPRIGYLSMTLAVNTHLREAFEQGLRDLGYVEGRSLFIEYRSAEGNVERLPTLAAELVALKVDLILAPSTLAAVAAKQVSTSVPIVSVAVTSGVVSSLARPDGNITGLAFFSPELIGKCLEVLHEAVPGVDRVAALSQWDHQGEG